MSLDKIALIEQLAARIRDSESVAQRASEDAREAARSIATESEKKEDGRVAIEYGSLAKGQEARSRKAQEDLAALAAFTRGGIPPFGQRSAIALGAIIDISSEGDRGEEERTFFLLPVGAGTELSGPGGDGFLSVITLASPVGRALLGRRAGDVVEVTIKGQTSEWTVVEVC